MTKSVISISGGLDSVTLLHYIVAQGETVHALAFDYGQLHTRELECAQWQCEQLSVPLDIIKLPELQRIASLVSALVNPDIKLPTVQEAMGDPQPASYVPNRNMLFLAYAVAYAESIGAHNVYYAAQKHDVYGYFDTTPQFVEALNNVYRLNRKSQLQVLAPFVTKSKADEILMGLLLGIDYGHTWSCYKGGAEACGVCATCAERLKGFMDAGLSDPLKYTTLPDSYRQKFPLVQ